jgi:ribosomal protein L32
MSKDVSDMSITDDVNHMWNSCSKKIPYRRKIRAVRAKERMERAGCEMKYLSIYECKYCGYYHLGHKRN